MNARLLQDKPLVASLWIEPSQVRRETVGEETHTRFVPFDTALLRPTALTCGREPELTPEHPSLVPLCLRVIVRLVIGTWVWVL